MSIKEIEKAAELRYKNAQGDASTKGAATGGFMAGAKWMQQCTEKEIEELKTKLKESENILIEFMLWFNKTNEGSGIDWIDIEDIQEFTELNNKPMDDNELTTEQKIEAVGNSEEVLNAVKLFIALMNESKIENSINIEYKFLNNRHKLELTKQ